MSACAIGRAAVTERFCVKFQIAVFTKLYRANEIVVAIWQKQLTLCVNTGVFVFISHQDILGLKKASEIRCTDDQMAHFV